MTSLASVFSSHLLVVDDDDRLRALLQQYLGEHGFFVSTAAHPREADAILSAFAVDGIVLDVMMPEETGLAYAHRLHAGDRPPPPILLLTALGESEDRIAGLEAGAADYLPKPFAPRELLLRVENMLRRPLPTAPVVPATQPRRVLQFGSCSFDLEQNRLTQADQSLYLTSGELDCLRVLAEHAGEAVTRENIADRMGDIGNVRSVDVQVNRLRKKIEPNPSKPIYLQTIRHAGYALYGHWKG